MSPARTTALRVALVTALCAGGYAFAQTPQAQSPAPTPVEQAQQMIRGGNLDGAMRTLDEYVRDHPKDARGRFLRGVVLAEQHRTDEAIAVYTQLTYDYPELPEPYNNLALLVASKGEYAKARDLLEMAVQAQPSYATAHENLGDVYVRLAAASYEKAAALEPKRESARKKLKIVNDLVPVAPTAATTPR